MVTIPNFVFEFFARFRDTAFTFFDSTKWLLLFIILLPLARSTLLFWRQKVFSAKLSWTVVEMKIPREITKSPRGMDQVFKALASLRNYASNVEERFVDGEVTVPFCLEVVGKNGEVRFFIRMLERAKGLVIAAFQAYYPDLEFIEVPDYAAELPKNAGELEARKLKMFGVEIDLVRDPIYPIKSYIAFETPEETQQFDPMSTLLEFSAAMKPGQAFYIQILASPKAPDWAKEWEEKVEELRATKYGPASPDTGGFAAMTFRSPGQTDVLKAVETNISKPAFDTHIRYLYIAPEGESYYPFAIQGLFHSLNQYGAGDLNSFKPMKNTSTKIKIWQFPYVFTEWRMRLRQSRILSDYRNRETQYETFMGRVLTSHPLNWNTHSKPIVLNSESLATLFHPPTWPVVTAPHVERVTSKKAGPPSGMEIFGDESEIAEFQ